MELKTNNYKDLMMREFMDAFKSKRNELWDFSQCDVNDENIDFMRTLYYMWADLDPHDVIPSMQINSDLSMIYSFEVHDKSRITVGEWEEVINSFLKNGQSILEDEALQNDPTLMQKRLNTLAKELSSEVITVRNFLFDFLQRIDFARL